MFRVGQRVRLIGHRLLGSVTKVVEMGKTTVYHVRWDGYTAEYSYTASGLVAC